MPLFRPVTGLAWFPRFADSIERLFREKLSRPLWLWTVATADLPTTPELGANEGAIAYDDTVDRVVVYTGAAWVGLHPYDASIATLAALSIVQGDLIYGSASETFSRLAKDTNATRYLSNTGTSNNPAWAQVNLANGVTGDLPFANIAQIATAKVLGRTTAGTGDIEELATTGTGNVVLSASPTFTGTFGAEAGTFTGLVTFGSTGADANPKVLVRGTAYAVRIGTDAAQSRIEGVDNTGVSSFQPLMVGGSVVYLAAGGSTVATVSSTGVDVVGLSRCDSFRIDQSPTAETPTATHTITISANGTDYKLLCVAA